MDPDVLRQQSLELDLPTIQKWMRVYSALGLEIPRPVWEAIHRSPAFRDEREAERIRHFNERAQISRNARNERINRGLPPNLQNLQPFEGEGISDIAKKLVELPGLAVYKIFSKLFGLSKFKGSGMEYYRKYEGHGLKEIVSKVSALPLGGIASLIGSLISNAKDDKKPKGKGIKDILGKIAELPGKAVVGLFAKLFSKSKFGHGFSEDDDLDQYGEGIGDLFGKLAELPGRVVMKLFGKLLGASKFGSGRNSIMGGGMGGIDGVPSSNVNMPIRTTTYNKMISSSITAHRAELFKKIADKQRNL